MGLKPKLTKIAVFSSKYLVAFVCAAYTFLAGFVTSNGRVLINLICEYFGFRLKAVRPVLPEIAFSELMLDDHAAHLLEPEGRSGNVSLFELLVICKLVLKTKPQQILEIGTFDGRTTLNLAANAPGDCKVYTLDLPPEDLNLTKYNLESFGRQESQYVLKPESGEKYKKYPAQAKIVQLLGDSAQFDFAPFRGKIDFIFVDGSHAYDYVISDSENACRMASQRALILWHDYDSWDGVTEALNKLYRENPRFNGLRRIRGTTLAVLLPVSEPA